MERVKYNKVEVCHGDSQKKFPVYEIYLDGVIVTKVSSEFDALEMVSRCLRMLMGIPRQLF